jgi:DNA (cytosine-5)-methyltransferase 1
VDNPKIITHLSLCSGYEGIGLGLRKVFPFLREIAFVEREGFAVANLVAKMEAGLLDTAPIHTDLKTFPYRAFLNKVDILSGGFPCQPFSQAGLKKSTEDPRHLFPYIEKGIKQCRPAIVFLENVEGILSSTTGDGQPVLQYVLRRLEALGYRSTAGIFSASEAGAPHQRKRVFILTARTSDGEGGRIQTEITPNGFKSKREKSNQTFGAKLRDAVETHEEKNWATPQVMDATRANSVRTPEQLAKARSKEEMAKQGKKRGGCKNLREDVVNWPTVQARDWKATAGTSMGRLSTTGIARGTNGELPLTVYREDGLLDRDNPSLNGKNPGSLNPTWVESLMGIPKGWTDLGSWGTDACHKQLK